MAAIKTKVTSLEAVPEALRQFYVQDGDVFVLVLEGEVPGFVPATKLAEQTSKLVEFRDNNIRLLKAVGAESVDGALTQVEALKAIDPKEQEALRKRIAEMEKAGVKGAEDVDARIKASIEAANAPLRQELEKERQIRINAQQRADRATLRSTIGDRFIKHGGRPAVLDFILSEAEKSFVVADDAVKAREGKFSPDNPGNPLSLEEWMGEITKTYDFAFGATQGGGTPAPAPGKPAPVVHKDGVQIFTNPTPEQLGDPTFAERLKKGEIRIE